MGKAAIQEHIGDGQYRVKYFYNIAEIEEAIARKETEITYVQDVEVPAAQTFLNAAKAVQGEKKADLNTAIISGVKDNISAATLALNLATADDKSALADLSKSRLKLAGLKGDLEYLKSHIPQDEEMDIWCADNNTGLTGDVGTIEVPGEKRLVPIIIKPGGENGDQAGYAESDGMITPSMALSPAENFVNLALLPGWQRWQPTFRLGTLTAIDNDVNTCELVLDEALSSQQQLSVNNDSLILTAVPVEYMRCHSAAFQVGDRVVVKFEPFGNPLNLDYRPKVIGFESSPKACRCKYLYTFDIYFNRVRRYVISNGTTPAEDGNDNYYTPSSIEKKYNGKLYTLFTNPAAPRFEIKNAGGVITTYNLEPIGDTYLGGYTTTEYDVKRLEIKNDKIYIHDYKYAIDTHGGGWQNVPNPPGPYGRIKTYNLDMTAIGTEEIQLPSQIADAYIAVDRDPEEALIYVLQQSATNSNWRVYIYDKEWIYRSKKDFTFRPATGQAISGWKKERIYVGSKATDAVPQVYVYCYDSNWNLIWRAAVSGDIKAIANNGEYVAVSNGGTIKLLSAATGAELAIYTMPTISNPGHTSTGYSAHRLAIYEDKLYVGLRLHEVWSGKAHPLAYIFDISSGGFEGKIEGKYIELARYKNTWGQWEDIYYSAMGTLAISACKEGWWLSLQRSDEYAWWEAAWNPPGTMEIEQNHVDEPGGVYIYEAGTFNQLGHMAHYAPSSSEIL